MIMIKYCQVYGLFNRRLNFLNKLKNIKFYCQYFADDSSKDSYFGHARLPTIQIYFEF